MSRRNSSTRRRSYGRRRHEINERRTPRQPGADWLEPRDEAGAEQPDASSPSMLGRRPLGGGPEGARP